MTAPSCVLLDRDGSINADRPRGVRRMVELEPGAVPATSWVFRANALVGSVGGK